MKARAVLLAVLLLASIPVIPVAANSTTHFGNTGFPSTINIEFPRAGGYDSSTNISLGSTSAISAAALEIRGLANSSGLSPKVIGLDIGDDGDREWQWGGVGNGSYGHLDELSNGYSRVAMNLTSGSNSNYFLRLPLNATVTSASMGFSTLNELTISGSDMKDSYLHLPHSVYGNASHKDHNHGSNNYTIVGKTEWSSFNIYRSAYWFDLGLLPGATVLDANLSFFITDGVNQAATSNAVTNAHTYTIYPLLKDWEEGLEVNSVVQQAAGVTWNNAIDNLTGSDYAWTSPGAGDATDKGATVASVSDSPANLELNWLDFQSQDLTSLVQDWVNGNQSNFGVLLEGDENTNKPDGSRLTIAGRGNSTYGPRLVVTFAGSDDVTAGLDVGADGNWEWNHTGNLSNASTTPDFSATLNSFLASSSASFTDSYGNEFVDIPLNVSANATLVMDEIDIQYDWTAAVGVSPQGDLLSELSQHLSNLTADATGNVSIPINISSTSAGLVELLNLWIGLGDRPPSIGLITIPSTLMTPNGESNTFSVEATSYQGLSNISWIALIPQLQNVASRPVFFHSLVNSSTWVVDPAGMVDGLSGQWVALNGDTGRMDWQIQQGWSWLAEENVTWLAQVMTNDDLLTSRSTTLMTDHERRMEISSFHVWDETLPTDAGTELFEGEWVAANDSIRVSGTVRFLNNGAFPLPNDVLIELENVSGNATVDSSGAFSINTNAPLDNQYDGFTITASLQGNFDNTAEGLAVRTFNVDATMPGILLHTPTGERVLPDYQQLFNLSIIDGISLDEGSLELRYWVESIHDDNDGIPQENEYASRPLLKQGDSEYFHASFDDSNNQHGQLVSLYVKGYDSTGNPLPTEAGLDGDLHHYSSLVPSPAMLNISSLEYAANGTASVPGHASWLNFTIKDINGLDDLDSVKVLFADASVLSWQAGANFTSQTTGMVVNSFSITEIDELIQFSIEFDTNSQFNPSMPYGQISIHVNDSSGIQILHTGISWSFDANVFIEGFSIESSNQKLNYDDYVGKGARLLMQGRLRYVAANLSSPSNYNEVYLEVPQDLPLLIEIDENGYFSGEMDVLGSGLFKATINVLMGSSEATNPPPIRLQLDESAPIIVGSHPDFIAVNSTDLILQFDIQEIGAGLSNASIPVYCQQMNGLSQIGEEITNLAVQTITSEVSRYQVNLSSQPIGNVDNLECWLDISDGAGNQLTGSGSSATWPIRIEIVETRADLHASSFSITSDAPRIGESSQVELLLVNLGNHSDESFQVSLQTHVFKDGKWHVSEVANQTIVLNKDQVSKITFTWRPDWQGQMNLVVVLDSTSKIAEQNENNSFIISLDVKAMSQEDGLLASQSGMAIAGIGIIGLFTVIMLGFALKRMKQEDEYEDWVDEEEVTQD
jgi:hypothetical protein